jgi:hypothetical protein
MIQNLDCNKRGISRVIELLVIVAVVVQLVWFFIVMRRSGPEVQPLSPDSHVNDYGDLVDLEHVNLIEEKARELKERTGSDIVVVTVRSTGAYGENGFRIEIEDYAELLRKKWEEMHPELRGTTLMLVDKLKGAVVISRSQRLAHLLPDVAVRKVLDAKIVPMLNEANKIAGELLARGDVPAKAREYTGKAIYEGVKGLVVILEEEYAKLKFTEDMVRSRDTKEVTGLGSLFGLKTRLSIFFYIFIIVGAILVAVVFFFFSRKRCPHCKANLTTETQVVEMPTQEKHGIIVRKFRCEKCGFSDQVEEVTFPGFYYLTYSSHLIRNTFKRFLRRRRRASIRRKH